MPGADILDQRDPLGKSFVGSLFFHGSLIALIVVGPRLMPKPIMLGDPTHNMGAIGVNVVRTIPLPRREGPVNPVANDTKAVAPQEPEPKAPPKKMVKEKTPPADAIPIPAKEKKTKPKKVAQDYRPEERYKENQLYSETAPALVSPRYGIQGNNGIGVGPSNPFGEQFGWYAQQIFDRVSQHWNRADVTSRPHAQAIIRFTLARDGSVQNLQLVQRSGSYTLDSSAQRAVLDAVPLPPFPRGFNYNSVNVDLTFELQQ